MSDSANPNQMRDLSSLANPYDFAKPVTRQDRFAGRESELADIKYYLVLASQTSEPMNLALIGERAAGKTSMLNIIDIEAAKAGLITVRINLNSADAEPINFFWKLYDAVVEAYCVKGHLFNPGSDEYIVYRRIIDSLDPTADSPNFQLRFPSHYALSVNGSRQISEVRLQRDLSYIYERSSAPCIIIFDECNVMTQNRVTLEMLRNVFMNISGYMIVLTGTSSFFPVLDEVFSPIIRQFKKINIKPFAEFEETKQCVFNPLQSVSLNPAELVSDDALYDIHTISRGRPYEIQLLCHFMFRRLQDHRATRMDVTADVMDDVLNELEANISGARPIIISVRKMTKRQLAAVSVFGRADRYGDLGLAWFMNSIESSADAFTRDELVGHLEELQKLGIFEVGEDSVIHFTGDDFDRIYLRYHAERLGLSVEIADFPSIIHDIRLAILLAQALEPINIHASPEFSRDPSLIDSVNTLLNSPMGEIPETSISAALFPIVTALRLGQLSIAVITITYRDKTARTSAWWPFNGEYTLTDDPAYVKLNEVIEQNGGSLSIESLMFSVTSEGDFLGKLLSSPNKRLRERIGTSLAMDAAEAYFDGEADSALAQARRAKLFPMEDDSLNDVGYIHMALGERSQAEEIDRQAAASASEEKDYRTAALALYNCAMAVILDRRFNEATDLLLQARQSLAAAPSATYRLQCLFVPVVSGETLTIQETWDHPELSAAIDSGISTLEVATAIDCVEIMRSPRQL
jgi:hypothetical protein